MGRYVRWLSDGVENFVKGQWDTDLRGTDSSAFARSVMQREGVYDAVRRFLLDVIQRDAVTPEEWRDLCNITVDGPADVRADAHEFWNWLFDGEPPARRGGSRGPLQLPHA